jgi:hypothetical protein
MLSKKCNIWVNGSTLLINKVVTTLKGYNNDIPVQFRVAVDVKITQQNKWVKLVLIHN